jgi:ABC-type Fe3+-hydroxamate transport system substrate-binding protein
MTRRGLLLGVIVGVFALVGCERSAPPSAPPPAGAAGEPRIAVMSPALAGTLRWLGRDGAIVGRHGFDVWSDRALPVCGDQAGFDYETLIRVNPTHIFVEWGDRALPDRLTALARERGWTIRNFSTLSLEDVERTADEIDAMFPVRSQAAGEAAPSVRLRRAWSPRPGVDPALAGRVLLLVSTSPPTALGPGSAHQQILTGMGGRAALASGGPYQTLDAEDVLKVAPDAIVLVSPRDPSSAGAAAAPVRGADALGPLAKLDIPAVRQGRVALLDDPQGLLPGAALVTFADALHAQLSAWVRGADDLGGAAGAGSPAEPVPPVRGAP